MEKFKRVELYDTFTIDHPITGEVIRVQAIPRDTISCNGCAFRKGDLEGMCKVYACVNNQTLDCLVFKKVK